MKLKISLVGTLAVVAAANCASGHGFGLSLIDDSQSNPIAIGPASEATILDPSGNPIGPQNLFISSFSGTASTDGSYGVNHGFAYATGAWPNYTATYNILSPLFFSDGTGTGLLAAVPAISGTFINMFDRDVGLYPGAAAGMVQVTGGIPGTGPFVPGYGVSLFDPHELQKKLYFGAGSSQTYGEYGFSYEVAVTLAGGETLTTGPLVDVFATDIGVGGFYSNAPISQQNTATMAIYAAAIAVPESWDYNGSGSYSDKSKWYQTVPNGMGFTVTFGGGATTAVNAPAISVTINQAVYAGTLVFNNVTTSYTLSNDSVSGHGLVLNNNGVGAAVNVISGNHAISADLTLADSGGTTFTIAPTSGLTISGAFAVDGPNATVTMNGSGALRITGPPTLAANTAFVINGGTLRFDGTIGSATIGAGTTVTVASGATLELAGSVSALSFGADRVAILNNSNSSGILVSGTHQQVGDINGSGDTQVNAGGDLTANHIIQNALVIGGTSGSPALVTIDASDALGNPLIDSSTNLLSDPGPAGLVLANSLTLGSPFGAGGISSANLSSVAGGGPDPAGLSVGNLAVGEDPSSIPEPSSLLLMVFALSIVIGRRFALRRNAP